MKPYRIFAALLCAAVLLSACDKRADIAADPCAPLATRKLTEAEQIKLGERCPRAGPPFKPSTVRQW